MRTLAKWHIWLGWLVGVPILIWIATGLFMVSRPIEQVRGEHLRIASKDQPLPPGSRIDFTVPSGKPIKSITAAMEDGQIVTRLERPDGTVVRYGEDGRELPALNEIAARALVARQVTGGKAVVSARLFPADKAPFDFRREMPVWQVVLEGGTHVYVGQQTGRIEALRTRWWRTFDFMWGLHIMDLQTREDTSHPTLILFAVLSLIGALIGFVLLFRRRRRAT